MRTARPLCVLVVLLNATVVGKVADLDTKLLESF